MDPMVREICFCFRVPDEVQYFLVGPKYQVYVGAHNSIYRGEIATVIHICNRGEKPELLVSKAIYRAYNSIYNESWGPSCRCLVKWGA